MMLEGSKEVNYNLVWYMLMRGNKATVLVHWPGELGMGEGQQAMLVEFSKLGLLTQEAFRAKGSEDGDLSAPTRNKHHGDVLFIMPNLNGLLWSKWSRSRPEKINALVHAALLCYLMKTYMDFYLNWCHGKHMGQI